MSPVQSERTRLIQAAIQEPSAKSEMGRHPIKIGGEKKLLDVYKLPTHLLVYNIRNGRFAAELRQLEKQLGRRLDPELPEDATEIRNLLLGLDPSATELLKEDLKKVGQTDPGVITHDGHVINGNRRMAILHELHREDSSGKYETLEVQVLQEGVSEKDLWRLEAGLQLGRDTRLEYGPVNDLLKIREGLSAGLTPKEIQATLYGIKDEQEIIEKDARLRLIDSYLDFIGEPDSYTRVKGAVEHFINLQSLLAAMEKAGVSKKDQHQVVLRAFELIRSGVSHMGIRALKKVYASAAARDHFLKAIMPKPGARKHQKEDDEIRASVREQFSIAKEYAELDAEAAKPERLVSRAHRAITAVFGHKTEIVANGSLHGSIFDIEKMSAELGRDCRATGGKGKRK